MLGKEIRELPEQLIKRWELWGSENLAADEEDFDPFDHTEDGSETGDSDEDEDDSEDEGDSADEEDSTAEDDSEGGEQGQER